MLTKSDYDKLVLMAFEALKRDIKDCEEYTVNDYNSIIEQERKKNSQNVQTPNTQTPKQPNVKPEKKEEK